MGEGNPVMNLLPAPVGTEAEVSHGMICFVAHSLIPFLVFIFDSKTFDNLLGFCSTASLLCCGCFCRRVLFMELFLVFIT